MIVLVVALLALAAVLWWGQSDLADDIAGLAGDVAARATSTPQECASGLGPFGPDTYVSSEVFLLMGSPYFQALGSDGPSFGHTLHDREDWPTVLSLGREYPNLDVVWDHTINLVNISWSENVDRNGYESGASFGLNLWLGDVNVKSAEGDASTTTTTTTTNTTLRFFPQPDYDVATCSAEIVSADFATADDVEGPPDVINPHSYVTQSACTLEIYSVNDDVLVGNLQSCEFQEVDLLSNAGGSVEILGAFVAVNRSLLD